MAKVIALDLGDAWTGIAISDPLGILPRPLKTVSTETLVNELKMLFKTEKISTAVVGLPITMKGKESAQTVKVRETFSQLERQFPEISWQLWDERLSSKRVTDTRRELDTKRKKKDRHFEHAKAAAFILNIYLQSLTIATQTDE